MHWKDFTREEVIKIWEALAQKKTVTDTVPKNEGEIFGGQYGYFTQKGVDEIISQGAKRWTKNGNDRLYIVNLAESIGGMDVSYYKNGNISYATLDGDKISNSAAGIVFSQLSKVYVDLNTGSIHGMPDESWKWSEFNTVRQRLLDYLKGMRYSKK